MSSSNWHQPTLASRRRWVLFLVAFSSVALLSLAMSRAEWMSTPRGAPATMGAPPPVRAAQRSLPEVATLHEQGTSAYHARLLADEDGLVLVTDAGFTTFRGGRAEEHAMALGPLAALRGDALVFWRSGHLREVALAGGAERALAAVARPPQYLFTSEGRLAWIHTGRGSKTSLETFSGGGARAVYEVEGGVAAPVIHATDIYWVAVSPDASWRIERIALDGQLRTRSAAQHGRPPAMLAVGHDGVYFYAGRERGVRRLTFDLERETSVASGVVCSPLAVSDRVVCAQVGGIFELSGSDTPPLFLASERAGPVTALAATRSRAYWVADNGAERLIVRSIALPER